MSKLVLVLKNLEHLSESKPTQLESGKKDTVFFYLNEQTNIRLYSLDSLQKLLNVFNAIQNGFKISKIAKMEAE